MYITFNTKNKEKLYVKPQCFTTKEEKEYTHTPNKTALLQYTLFVFTSNKM